MLGEVLISGMAANPRMASSDAIRCVAKRSFEQVKQWAKMGKRTSTQATRRQIKPSRKTIPAAAREFDALWHHHLATSLEGIEVER